MWVVETGGDIGNYDAGRANVQDLVNGVRKLLVDVEDVRLHRLDLVAHLLNDFFTVFQRKGVLTC
jgi:hypothetical protein